jgi:hypothetical protein
MMVYIWYTEFSPVWKHTEAVSHRISSRDYGMMIYLRESHDTDSQCYTSEDYWMSISRFSPDNVYQESDAYS